MIIFSLVASDVSAQTASGPVYPYAFQTSPGALSGQILIQWTDDGSASRYDLMYGFGPGQYQWGAQKIPFTANSVNSFTINSLTAGTIYYLALVAKKGDDFVAISGPIAARASANNTSLPKQTILKSQKTLPTSAGPVSNYNFQASTGQIGGTIDLTWSDDGSANQYDIAYGFGPGQYRWGALDLPETPNTINHYTVRFLTPGVTYYFSLVPENSGKSITTTFPIGVSAR